MRLSRIWRILQIKEGVIHRGRRPRWITPSEICRILHILRKPHSIIALLFIQNISFFLKEFRYFRSPNITQPCPQVFSVNGSIICGGLTFDVIDLIWRRFWRHWFSNFRKAPLLTSLIQYGDDSFQIWWTAAGYGELCVWFKPIRNGKIFWMNNKIRYWTMQTLPIVIVLSHLRALHDALRETSLKVANI